MITIALFGSRHQDAHADALMRFIDTLGAHSSDIRLTIEQRFCSYLEQSLDIHPSADTFSRLDYAPDLALSIGGDGTFLRVARIVGALGTPIMGINSGHLGYLSAASITECDTVVSDIINHRYSVEPRSLIAISSDCTDALPDTLYALNEVAILRRDTASMISIDATLDDLPLATYRGDGLIVSTPTGSTGYNLSVGGPLVAPKTPCWIISPVAPHSLTMRPLVVNDTARLQLVSHSRSETYMLSIDGKATIMPERSALFISRAPFCINVVHRHGQTFAATIRTKLLWGSDRQ